MRAVAHGNAVLACSVRSADVGEKPNARTRPFQGIRTGCAQGDVAHLLVDRAGIHTRRHGSTSRAPLRHAPRREPHPSCVECTEQQSKVEEHAADHHLRRTWRVLRPCRAARRSGPRTRRARWTAPTSWSPRASRAPRPSTTSSGKRISYIILATRTGRNSFLQRRTQPTTKDFVSMFLRLPIALDTNSPNTY